MQLPFEERVFGVFAILQFAAIRRSQNHTVANDDAATLGETLFSSLTHFAAKSIACRMISRSSLAITELCAALTFRSVVVFAREWRPVLPDLKVMQIRMSDSSRSAECSRMRFAGKTAQANRVRRAFSLASAAMIS
ncbi:hypothetical protein [Paraburkholderia sp. RL17-373-BIF-A]|uniref:hypothetical protein n=1 Tax=Paraburkholderia sp. RL17-373-BIF-A TaxID=3031629 RepID=UPI0038B7239D